MLIDSLLIGMSFVLAYILRYEFEFIRPVDEANYAPFGPFIPYTLIFIVWVIAAKQGAGLYQIVRDRTLVNEAFQTINAASNAAIIIMALSFLLRPLVFSRLLIVQAAIISVILLFIWRLVLRALRNRRYAQGLDVENVLLVGIDEMGRGVMRAIVARPDLGYRLVGFVDDHPERQKAIGRVPALGAISDIERIIAEHQVDLVIITLPWLAQRRVIEMIDATDGVDVRVVPDVYQFNMSQVRVEMLGGVPLLGIGHEIQFHRSSLLAKRIMDVVLTLMLMPLILPIMALTALAIRLESPGPVLFYQTRLGFQGKPFRMVKFRSMVVDAEAQQDRIVERTADDPEGKYTRQAEDPRITRVGHFIRRTSIDELPQLFNVLRGEMSLVGPRPPIPEEVALYKDWHRQRLMTRPGMTGLWQVSGRSDIPFEEKALLDIYYIENWSLAFDLQILLQTAPQVLFSRGAY